ncbi:MAG: PQQ-dependent sugar dehydrogenase [Acidobacteria bacterium]|nr:PQQ-dependent sugar dehydrogenase [Acidobacteriota bacterium]
MKLFTSYLKLSLTTILIFSVVVVISCDTLHTPNISNGTKVFEANCATCHTFQQDGIGPQLGGLKGVVEKDYLIKFIQSPKAMVESKHARATAAFNKFGTMMPDFHQLKTSDVQDVVAYILAQPAPNKAANEVASQNPIPEPIAKAGITLNLQKVLQFPYTNDKQPRTRVNKMGFHPITKETLVADLQGKIYILNSTNQPEVYFDATRYFKNFVNNPGLATGLGSFAFHPDFIKNKLAYTTHTEPANTAKADFAYGENMPVKLQWVVIEWTVNDPKARELTGTPRELMRVNVVNVIHGMQEIAFNPFAKPADEDYGLLYIGMGDGGAVERGYPDIARNKNNIWGKVLRIDPRGNNSQNGKYGIPPSNPYVNKDGLDEVYASGFRNPNRITWTKDGKVIVSNIGQRQVESLYLLKAGKDYGWPDREGTFAIPQVANVNSVAPLPADDAKFGYSYPIAQFDHDEGSAIIGGFEYTGSAVPQLRGKYIFGEIVRGRVFYLDLKEIKEGAPAKIQEFPLALAGQPTTLKDQCKVDKVDLRLGRDAAGEIYLMTKSDGVMYKIVK